MAIDQDKDLPHLTAMDHMIRDVVIFTEEMLEKDV